MGYMDLFIFQPDQKSSAQTKAQFAGESSGQELSETNQRDQSLANQF